MIRKKDIDERGGEGGCWRRTLGGEAIRQTHARAQYVCTWNWAMSRWSCAFLTIEDRSTLPNDVVVWWLTIISMELLQATVKNWNTSVKPSTRSTHSSTSPPLIRAFIPVAWAHLVVSSNYEKVLIRTQHVQENEKKEEEYGAVYLFHGELVLIRAF